MTRQESRDILHFCVPVAVIDILIHFGSYFASWFILHESYHGAEEIAIGNWLAIAALLFMSYCYSIWIFKLKLAGRGISLTKVALRAIVQTITTIAFFALFVAIIYKLLPRRILVLETGFALLLVTISHVTFTALLRRFRAKGRNSTSMLFIGADRNNMHIMHYVQREEKNRGYRIVGAFTSSHTENVPEEIERLGSPSEAIAYLEEHLHCTDTIFCSLRPGEPEEKEVIDKLVYLCEQQLITFYYVPTMEGYVKRRLAFAEFGGRLVLKLHDEPLALATNQFLKRAGDIVVSGLFLITIFPLLYIFVGIGVKLSSPGPIFFKQKRTGYNGKSFDCLKFRSMRQSTDADTKQATADDPRKTKFGDFIRKTSLDEFPQFINVFKGDMSIVGPRPHMEYHTEKYSELISTYMVRHLVRPGITGWAQVSGCRGETKTVEEMADRVEHDIWYLEHWTPWLDIEIIMKTIKQVVGGDKQAY